MKGKVKGDSRRILIVRLSTRTQRLKDINAQPCDNKNEKDGCLLYFFLLYVSHPTQTITEAQQ